MTNETRNRIEAYKKALPEMKERVAAAAFLMVMSVIMMASASFAWLTISRHPEVSNVSTTVAANGNLEIALATSSTPPEESKVGDSSATKGQNIAASNVTWGNLVNLSDPSYGLDNLTLRPAQLNQSSLLSSPLYGAVYQEDGRVEKLNSSFAYSIWNSDIGVFEVSNDIGVRAISSTKLGEVSSESTAVLVYQKRQDTIDANTKAGAAYTEITTNEAWMDSLAVAMGTYMTAKLNSGQDDESLTNPTMEQEDVINLAEMFGAFVNVYDLQFEAMTKQANYQLFLKNGAGASDPTLYTEKTVEYIRESSEASLKSEGLQVSGLDKAKTDYPKLVEGYEKLLALSTQGTVKWTDSGLNSIVNSLVDVGACTLDGTKINNIGASNATKYLNKTCAAVITNGILYNFEEMNGTRCNVQGLTVKATVKRGITVNGKITANITTNAPTPDKFTTDLEYADNKYPTTKIKEVAQDTYGLAVDLWVRTNASGSYLTLEGNVLTTSEQVRATGKDASGNKVELYTLKRTETADDETITYTIDVYPVVKEDVTTWYNASSYAAVTLEEGEEPTPKMEEVITVIGYEGENRVWEDNSQLPADSTTQGSGSCYVYYADTPEDQARSLELLESMNVAFVDDTGKLLATAIMDTERYYADNGRVTVPLVLKNDSLNIGTNVAGDTIYAITPLVQNSPTRITAIVYLDGTKLSNEDVLAASEIQGKLNIQFGSSVALSHAKDETLLNATRSVSATVDKTTFVYADSLGENGKPMTTNVTVSVDGDAPKEVKAFFIRAISSTQGSREEVMTFEPQSDGTWKAPYTFTAPGNYILRSVELDGQAYDLETCPTVTIEGFTVDSLSCTQAEEGHITIMTAASSSTVDLKLQFKSNDEKAMPKKVQGRFLRDTDGTAVNINFTYNSNTGFWTGQATFISSGEYTLEYLVLDGEYTKLNDGFVQTATVYLGMKTAVYTDSPTSFKYIPDEMADNEKNLSMKVKIMDNTGKVMEGLTGARLYYLMEGSSVLERGFSTQLTWDAGTGYYIGTFNGSKVGVFKFSHVTVGDNTLTYAETSPIFRVISPEPPSYEGFENNPYVYSETSNITMNARLSYSSTATVAAVIRNLDDDKTYEVQGTEYTTETQVGDDETSIEVQKWQFPIPTAANGKQDGNWQLEEVRVWNYYDAAGNYIEAEVDDNGNLVPDGVRDEALVFTVVGNVTKAVNTLTVTVNLPENFDAHLGNSETSGSGVTIATATATFLDEQTVNVPTVTIVDFEGEPIGITNANGTFTSYISNVKFVYDYDGKSETYGGYTSSSVVATDGIKTINMTSDDGMTFAQSGTDTISVQYAGVYTPTLYYTVNGVTYTKTAKDIGTTAPTFAVWSKTPTVTITGITPTGSNPTKITYTTKSVAWYLGGGTQPTFTATGNQTSSFNTETNTATLYAVATADNSTQRHGNFTRPTVTLTVGEVTSDCAVSVVLPAGDAADVTFSRTGNGAMKGTLGTVSQINSWTSNAIYTHTLSAYYGHGSQTISSATVVCDNVTYTVTLPKPIVINNPSSVNQ